MSKFHDFLIKHKQYEKYTKSLDLSIHPRDLELFFEGIEKEHEELQEEHRHTIASMVIDHDSDIEDLETTEQMLKDLKEKIRKVIDED